MADTTVQEQVEQPLNDNQEVAKNVDSKESKNIFEGRTFDWWSEKGSMYGLFRMNKLRIPMVQQTLMDSVNNGAKENESETKDDKPLQGFNIIDIGCGGGLMTEPLAALGANVTGIDVSKESIQVAKEHLKQESSSLESNCKYIHTSIEDFIEKGENLMQFDAAIASEVAEHVPDLEKFIASCTKVVKPGGFLFITTINRTIAAYLRYILLDEKILRVLPRGTHPYNMLVPPARLQKILEESKYHLKLA